MTYSRLHFLIRCLSVCLSVCLNLIKRFPHFSHPSLYVRWSIRLPVMNDAPLITEKKYENVQTIPEHQQHEE